MSTINQDNTLFTELFNTISQVGATNVNFLNLKDTIKDIENTEFAELTLNTPIIDESNGLVTATASLTQAGYIAEVPASKTLQLSTQAATTITPGTTEQTVVASGKYTTGDIKVAGSANLVAENIKEGVNIFGVKGTYSGATASDILAYDVVAQTTEPEKKENRIWVETSVPMTYFGVRNTWNDSDATPGVIVLQGATDGAFNPTSSNTTVRLFGQYIGNNFNTIQVKPSVVVQVQDTVNNWVLCDAYVCHSNTWVQISSSGILYQPNSSTTELWIGRTSHGSCTIAPESIKLSCTYTLVGAGTDTGGWEWGRVDLSLKSPIDLTPYTTLYITCSSTRSFDNWVSISSTQYANSGYTAMKQFSPTSTPTTFSMNISDITGERYINYVIRSSSGTTNATITKIWLV